MAESGKDLQLNQVDDIKAQVVVDADKLGKNVTSSVAPDFPDDEDYDPHLHRNIEKPTTNFETLVHILKGSLGTGILAMPQAFLYAGLIPGIIVTIIIGYVCTYLLHVLVRAQYELCKRKKIPLLSYPESMRLALESGPSYLKFLAKPSYVIVDIFLLIYQLGICCVYIVFVSQNIQKVVNPLAGISWSIHIYMLIVLGPLILLNLVRNLKLLAPLSSLANVMTLVGLIILITFLVRDILPLSELDMVGPVEKFPLFFGTTLFALEAVGVVITLENNMKTPKSFGTLFGVLNVGIFIIVVLYVLIGILGYIRYGKDCKGSVTLNLPDTNPWAQATKIIFAVAIFISYALNCYVPVDIMKRNYLHKLFDKANPSKKLAYEYILRVVLVLITFVLAIAVPLLNLFISLFGAFCLSALGLAFPALMEICIYYPNNFGPFKYRLIKNIIFILFGILGLITGTYVSLLEIVLALSN